ncbi:MAG: SprT family zinc-dependent metalloprotease [Bacteroidales bacterium]|jgi:predicted metal-dependent hydrolase
MKAAFLFMSIKETEGITYIVDKASRKSVSISVKRNGSVHVRAPFWMTYGHIERFVKQKADWIRERQKALQREPVLPSKGPERKRLTEQAAALFKELAQPWEHRFDKQYGVRPKGWRVREMNTRWGSCSLKTGYITLNLRLYYKSPACIEYVIVHELCHLLEARHDKNFYRILEKELPDWKSLRKELNH